MSTKQRPKARAPKSDIMQLWTILSSEEFIALGAKSAEEAAARFLPPRHLEGLDRPATPLTHANDLPTLFQLAKQLHIRVGRVPVRLQVEVEMNRQTVGGYLPLYNEDRSLHSTVGAYLLPVPRAKWLRAIIGTGDEDDSSLVMHFRDPQGRPVLADPPVQRVH